LEIFKYIGIHIAKIINTKKASLQINPISLSPPPLSNGERIENFSLKMERICKWNLYK
jgi:hypothetical protein